MTTDLIKTLEGLEKRASKPWRNNNWDNDRAKMACGDSWAEFGLPKDRELAVQLRNSLPQIISELKDSERMREAIEKVLECDKEGSIDLGMNLFHYLNNSLTESDTKHEKGDEE